MDNQHLKKIDKEIQFHCYERLLECLRTTSGVIKQDEIGNEEGIFRVVHKGQRCIHSESGLPNSTNAMMEYVDCSHGIQNILERIVSDVCKYRNTIGDIEYIEFVKEQISNGHGLNIWDKGNPIVTHAKDIGGLFCQLDRLKNDIANMENYDMVVSLRNDEQEQERKQKEDDGFSTDEAKAILKKTIELGLCDESYKWRKSISLWGYYVDRVSAKLDIRQSNDRIKWKPFQIKFHMTETELRTARQAVNTYKNKGSNPPEGDDLVNRVLK